MHAPAVPLDEARRLEMVRALALLDTPAEERFDRITRLALRLFNVPCAAISIVDGRRVFFKSSHGLPFTQLSRDASFCGHAIVGEECLIVADTLADRRFSANPLVTSSPHIRFYAGAPLATFDGSRVAALSLFDSRPRSFSPAEHDALRDLASIAESEIRNRPLTDAQIEFGSNASDSSRIDALTRLWSRAAALEILDRELQHALAGHTPLTVLLIDVDRMHRFNDAHGHAAGDAALTDVARVIRSSLRPYDSIARYGGEEFLALLPGVDHEQAALTADRIRLAITTDRQRSGRDLSVTIGGASVPPHGVDRHALVRAAEGAVRAAKGNGGDRVYVTPAVP